MAHSAELPAVQDHSRWELSSIILEASQQYMQELDPDLNVDSFATRDVSQIARISLRQLQWLDERNVISPDEEGRRRLYLPNQVIEIMVIADLRRKGLSLQKIRRFQHHLRREIGRRIGEILSGNADLYVLTDGRSAHIESCAQRLIKLLKNSDDAMCLVSLSDLGKRLMEFDSRRGLQQHRKRQLRLF